MVAIVAKAASLVSLVGADQSPMKGSSMIALAAKAASDEYNVMSHEHISGPLARKAGRARGRAKVAALSKALHRHNSAASRRILQIWRDEPEDYCCGAGFCSCWAILARRPDGSTFSG